MTHMNTILVAAYLPLAHISLAGLNPRYASTLVLLAQTSIDLPLNNFLAFLSKIMLLIGVVMIFYGGWKIHRGETSEGLLAIVGGFIVALSVPILRVLAGFGGISF